MHKIFLIILVVHFGCATTSTNRPNLSHAQRECFIDPSAVAQTIGLDQQYLIQKDNWHIIFNNKHLNPDLVIYSMKFNPAKYSLKRKDYSNKFHIDERVSHSANDQYYAKSGYDKGHMAPAKDFSFSREAALSTFLYSNIAPQTAQLNRNVWRKYEEHFREWSCGHNSRIQVLTGSLYKQKNLMIKLKGNSAAPTIPDAFYKIVLVESEGGNKCSGIAIVEDNEQPNKEIFKRVFSVADFSKNVEVWYEEILPVHATFSEKFWYDKGSRCKPAN
jgi:endonuclease G